MVQKSGTTITFVLSCSILACKQSEGVNPNATGLAGTWILFQSRSWDGNQWVTKTIPTYPRRTITFADPNHFSAIAIEDTLLAQSTFFSITNGGIIGPAILLKKNATSSNGGSFTYNPGQETLDMNSLSSSTGYSFRRF